MGFGRILCEGADSTDPKMQSVMKVQTEIKSSHFCTLQSLVIRWRLIYTVKYIVYPLSRRKKHRVREPYNYTPA
jgi:hypothetical protein